MNDGIPQDSMILFSYINLKLRDNYDSLDELCEDLDIDRDELCGKLASAGFEYSEKYNKFW